jgi:hypothetical protein
MERRHNGLPLVDCLVMLGNIVLEKHLVCPLDLDHLFMLGKLILETRLVSLQPFNLIVISTSLAFFTRHPWIGTKSAISAFVICIS